MKKEKWSKLGALALLSTIWLGGCSNANSVVEDETHSSTSPEVEQSPSTEEVVVDTPTDEAIDSEDVTNESEQIEQPEKDDSVGKDEESTDEMYDEEMENMRFFRWDGIVESLPYEVVMHHVDENNYATVVIDLAEIQRVMEEEKLEHKEAIYRMVREVVSFFPDREKEGYLFEGYCLQFAKFESALAAELIMTSEDYVNTDWESFNGTLASGGEMLMNDLMMN